jgi:hypothetical protein
MYRKLAADFGGLKRHKLFNAVKEYVLAYELNEVNIIDTG